MQFTVKLSHTNAFDQVYYMHYDVNASDGHQAIAHAKSAYSNSQVVGVSPKSIYQWTNEQREAGRRVFQCVNGEYFSTPHPIIHANPTEEWRNKMYDQNFTIINLQNGSAVAMRAYSKF